MKHNEVDQKHFFLEPIKSFQKSIKVCNVTNVTFSDGSDGKYHEVHSQPDDLGRFIIRRMDKLSIIRLY